MTAPKVVRLPTIDPLPFCWLDTETNESAALKIAERNKVKVVWFVESNLTYYIARVAE